MALSDYECRNTALGSGQRWVPTLQTVERIADNVPRGCARRFCWAARRIVAVCSFPVCKRGFDANQPTGKAKQRQPRVDPRLRTLFTWSSEEPCKKEPARTSPESHVCADNRCRYCNCSHYRTSVIKRRIITTGLSPADHVLGINNKPTLNCILHRTIHTTFLLLVCRCKLPNCSFTV